jgi:hypothetical protein
MLSIASVTARSAAEAGATDARAAARRMKRVMWMSLSGGKEEWRKAGKPDRDDEHGSCP